MYKRRFDNKAFNVVNETSKFITLQSRTDNEIVKVSVKTFAMRFYK